MSHVASYVKRMYSRAAAHLAGENAINNSWPRAPRRRGDDARYTTAAARGKRRRAWRSCVRA